MAYLDHAATTPMLPEAIEAMAAEMRHTGNPSSLHTAGRRARRIVEESRERLAEAFSARPSEIVLTGGGTESDNLAVKGLFWAAQGGRPPPTPGPRRRRRAPRRPRPGRLAGRPRGRPGRAAPGRRAGPGRPRDRRRGHRARPRGRGADLAHVGQQRDRHRAAAGRDRGAGPRARHPGPLRRGPGRRSAAGRLRGFRARRDDPHRAQAGRPVRGRRPRARPGPRPDTAAARRRAGARRSLRHLGRPSGAGLLDRGAPRDH